MFQKGEKLESENKMINERINYYNVNLIKYFSVVLRCLLRKKSIHHASTIVEISWFEFWTLLAEMYNLFKV